MVNLSMLFTRLSIFTTVVLALSIPTYATNPATMTKGLKVYLEYCKTCHQANGQGTPGVYPPLANSDYIRTTPKQKLIQQVVNGMHGKIVVNGKPYNAVMAPLPKKYSREDIANVLTYVFNSFGNSKGAVTVAEVKKACPKR